MGMWLFIKQEDEKEEETVGISSSAYGKTSKNDSEKQVLWEFIPMATQSFIFQMGNAE